MDSKGFNMMELLVVCIIVGILASIAIVKMQGPKEEALTKEAKSNLKLIAAAEKVYRLEIGDYVAASNEGQINDRLRLRLPASANRSWRYRVTKPSAQTFNATAVRNTATGGQTYYMTNTMEEPAK